MTPTDSPVGSVVKWTLLLVCELVANRKIFIRTNLSSYPMAALGELQYLSDARQAVFKEQQRIEAEVAAFREFQRRIQSLETEQASTAVADPMQVPTQIISDGVSGSLTEVYEAYIDTVMSLEHYEEDYGESLQVNIRNEFGPEIAQAVCQQELLTVNLKNALISATSSARTTRDNFLEELKREEETLEKAKTTFQNIENPFMTRDEPLNECSLSTLGRMWSELDSIEESVRDLAKMRQTEIQTRRKRIPEDELHLLCEYLYTDLPVDYPILADAATQCRQLSVLRRRIMSQCFQQA